MEITKLRPLTESACYAGHKKINKIVSLYDVIFLLSSS